MRQITLSKPNWGAHLVRYLLLLLVIGINASNAQVRVVVDDTIYIDNEPIGLVVDKGYKRIIYFTSSKLRLDNTQYFVGELNKKYKDQYIDTKVDRYVLKPEVSVRNSLLYFKKKRIGTIALTIIGSEVLAKLVVESRWVESRDHGYIQKEVREQLRNTYKRKIDSDLITDYSIEDKRLARVKRIADSTRIATFFDVVYQRLGGELDNIEGIFQSIDLGQSFDYSVAILKSIEDPTTYNGWVLSSVNIPATEKVQIGRLIFDIPVGPQNNVGIGTFIFSLKKTAQSNMYLLKYFTTGGYSTSNTLTGYENGLIKIGPATFVKMYPSESDKRAYNYINPLVDWHSSGSGVLVHSNGIVATNYHVVKGATKIRVQFTNTLNTKSEYEASLIGFNEEEDVAILKIIESFDFNSSDFLLGWESSLELGKQVFTLGYPISGKMSDNVKVVNGIVSSTEGPVAKESFFQTTLPVWYGNSGGPCFDNKGNLLGLVTRIEWDKGEKVENVCYVTPTSNILELLNRNHIEVEEQDENSESAEISESISKLVPYSVFIKVNY
jgi:hypothetical protein